MDLDFKTAFWKIIWPAIGKTLYMVSVSAIFSVIFGFILAIILYLTAEGGLKENKAVNRTLDTLVNIIRSFPFIILLVTIIPLTRAIVGTSVGSTAAIVPLVVSSTPFIARVFEGSFKEVDSSLIEAGKAFGLTDFQIMKNIVVKESVPSLISNTTLVIIAILGSSAMAGTVGGGGLGAVAMMYGYQNFNDQIMYGTVLVIIIIVQVIQLIGSRIYDKSK